MSDTERGSPIVVFVHGIGSQSAGDTLRSMVAGLRQGWPSADVVDETEQMTMTVGTTRVRMREARWADILDGQTVTKTYDFSYWAATAWLPLFNLLLWPINSGSRRATTFIPQLCARLVWLATALVLIGSVGTALFVVEPIANRLSSSKLSKLLDDVVSDVTNYVRSVSGLADRSGPIAAAAAAIDERVRAAIAAAQRDSDRVLVVAHSLGSVIAHRVLAGFVEHSTRPAVELITVGSPLGRFQFVWPWTVTTPIDDTIGWTNFYDPFDAVSSKLTAKRGWGSVHSIRLFGRTGAFTSHTTYQLAPQLHVAIANSVGVSTPIDAVPSIGVRLHQVVVSLRDVFWQVLVVIAALIVCVVASAAVISLAQLIAGRFVIEDGGPLNLYHGARAALPFLLAQTGATGLVRATGWAVITRDAPTSPLARYFLGREAEKGSSVAVVIGTVAGTVAAIYSGVL